MINAVHSVLKNTEFVNWVMKSPVQLAKWCETKHTFLHLSVTAPLSLKTKLQVTLSLTHMHTHRHAHAYIYTTLHISHACTHTHHMHTNNSELFWHKHKKVQTNTYLTRTHSMQIFGEIPFIKPYEQQINGQKKNPMKNENNSFIFHRFWPFCGLIKGISLKMCILCVRVK